MKNTNNSVKKHQTYLVLFLAVLFSGTMNAKVNNYVGAYGFLGEWTLRPVESNFKPSLGVAGGAGFMYELQASKSPSKVQFLFDVGLGAWGGMTSYGQSTDMIAPLLNQTDLQGDKFDYMYEINDRHDQYKNVAIQVPILFGFQYHKFYMMVGAKMNYSVFTKTYTTANVNTYGHYDKIPDLRNMPDYQFFNDTKLNASARTKFNWDVDLSLEIGGRLGLVTDAVGYDVPKRTVEYRLAGFIDYGLTDLHFADKKDALNTDGLIYDTNPSSANYVYQTRSMVDNLQVNDVMSTEGFAKQVNNIMVGVKFTILFQLPEEPKCVICQDAYRSSIGSRRGSVKYEE
jgi:hypothetical protein